MGRAGGCERASPGTSMGPHVMHERTRRTHEPASPHVAERASGLRERHSHVPGVKGTGATGCPTSECPREIVWARLVSPPHLAAHKQPRFWFNSGIEQPRTLGPLAAGGLTLRPAG